MSSHINHLRHLYLHIPFCEGKCHYCGFYSVTADHATHLRYPRLICRELDLSCFRAAPLQTIYTGGGTPGLLGADGFRLLAAELRQRGVLPQVEEWTVELNPASTNASLLATLLEIGVTRLSIGAQSFDDAVLRTIGRRHSAAAIGRAVALARAEGFDDYGLDLIAGLPGVTLQMWRETLERAVALGGVHLSVYALGIEPGTLLMEQVRRGRAVPSDEAQLEALSLAEEVLTNAGFERYEISNYALPGRACHHNLAVWRGEDYLGLGPSAASRCGCRRWTNQADAAGYLQALEQGHPPPRSEDETLDPEDDALERFVFGLRLNDGVSPAAFAHRHKVLAYRVPEWEQTLARLSEQAIVSPTTPPEPRGWRLTPRGREVADAVIRELI